MATRTIAEQAAPGETITHAMREAIVDEEHLRLLAIGHYVTGGLCILFHETRAEPRRRLINLLSIPVGTLLGVASLVVLGRNSVKRIYGD